MNLRAAIYSRYSSDLQSPASIEDQVRKCREYAAAHDFEVLDQHIYSDAGITGTITSRPALQRLLHAVDRKAFDVLLVDDTSRLSRDTADALTIFKRLTFAGVRLISVSQGIDSDNKQAHVLMTIHGLTDHLYSEELSTKAFRGGEGTVIRGFSAGGKTYGYTNVRTSDGKTKDIVQRINAAQKMIVERIFEHAALATA